ncbi:cobyric acid synthase [Fundidesulfovibrio terrae]|uniref:cobyric acid synthase n=1 Tax=Fundidesulfovibrio terrae TaxID=2922866 RepID=UPI001FAF120B|nr:cobyric acid synthase [Fundidesulfovibrio terrae]
MRFFPHGGDVRGMAETLGCDPSEILDFSANINPLGPPEWLRPVISASVSELVHYPDPHCRALIDAAAGRHGVDPATLLAGNGTSELLFAMARSCGHARAVVPVPSYYDYQTACRRADMDVVRLPLAESGGFVLDPEALSRALKALPGPAAVFLARPNNPTGLDVDAAVVRELAAAHPECLFVADEAFGSFVEGFESLMRERPDNVAVLLSLTKMFAIPGLRLGLACAGEALAEAVKERIAPWSVNTLAQAVGVRAVQDCDFEARSRAEAGRLREALSRALEALPGLTVYPGAANYLLCRLDAPEVPALRAALLEKRIAIRDCSNYAGLDQRFFRVAVRREDDNERLVDALAESLAPPAKARPELRSRPTPALMVAGTTSNAGKSVIAAALCRILRQDGVRVAPFKAQNMSLNSFVTARGEEMGRAQVLQAKACGLAPEARMNPVLLKPCSDTGSQVIVMGRPVGTMRVREYVAYKPTAFEAAKRAYDSLASEFDAVILEGAGSPAEVNLKSHDMVNMAMAAYARSRVLLVGDIDRGGVFAALAGTMELLSESERALVGGYVLNRFRGDPSLLEPAHRFMRELTGKPVIGVVPDIAPLNLPEEDSVSFKAGACWNATGRDLDIAVLDLPHISNFTDFDALAGEPDAGLRVVRTAAELGRPDAVILPGSKNTLADLARLRETGLAEAIAALAREGSSEIAGVCAGLQMLGERLTDPTGLESDRGEDAGLGLLDLATELLPEKTLAQSRAVHLPSGLTLAGYEIHHGVTRASGSQDPEVLARSEDGRPLAWGRHGAAWGTYLHGVFDQPGFRRWWLDSLRARKGLAPLAPSPQSSQDGVEAALDRLAATVRASLDMDAVYALLGL